MNAETIDHITLLRLAEGGAVRKALAVGLADGWGIVVQYGKAERALAAQRSQKMRIFRKLETLVNYLKGIGIARFEVDTANYGAEVGKTARTRPDTAEKMKRAHEAAAYDQWLAAEIQQAIDDPRPNVAHDDVMRRMDERIAAIKARKAVEAAEAGDVSA